MIFPMRQKIKIFCRWSDQHQYHYLYIFYYICSRTSPQQASCLVGTGININWIKFNKMKMQIIPLL